MKEKQIKLKEKNLKNYLKKTRKSTQLKGKKNRENGEKAYFK